MILTHNQVDFIRELVPEFDVKLIDTAHEYLVYKLLEPKNDLDFIMDVAVLRDFVGGKLSGL